MIVYHDGKPTNRKPRDVLAVYFDMDGTIADLYRPMDWLERLVRGDESLYADAAPMLDLRQLMDVLKAVHVHVGVVSWLAKNSNRAFDRRVRDAKEKWLVSNFPIASEIHIIKHGTRKRYAAKLDGVLIDDELANCIEWSKGGRWAVNVSCGNDVLEFVKRI